MDDWEAVVAEREDLADLGESLSDTQWDAPSLCAGWKVRHVFAHVVMGAEGGGVSRFLAYLIRSGFNFNRASQRLSIRVGDDTSPQELAGRLRESAVSRRRLPGTTPAGLLAEAIVHGQDMRRPLAIDRVPPVERTVRALWSMVRTGSVLGNKDRIAGLRLVATDTEWSHGEGPEVRGPAEALLMATCGRRVALDDLQGPGLDTLRSR
ncbi:MAG: maleylpyruvate isomerase family mycothiol-dependent enzyme [Acidimicrobiia bacterium]